MTELQTQLSDLKEAAYADFMRRLLPDLPPEKILGVRTPQLRRLAKQLRHEGAHSAFLLELPHTYFEENQLHAFLLSEEKEYSLCLEQVEAFLPFVDNWATCDQLSPRCFAKHTQELLRPISSWLRSAHPYTVRFGIEMLMNHYLGEHFSEQYPQMVAEVHSEEYYVNMMSAWYFATALAMQYDRTVPFLTESRLDAWVHNRTIRKACESLRISPEQKSFLRTLKR